MKVLDLQCSQLHVFEGWFSSEDDFFKQNAYQQISCPMCGDAVISKRLSAPRLNLVGDSDSRQHEPTEATPDVAHQKAWLAVARQILANTEDVGAKFAEEARKIHYGETENRGIRGKATPAEKAALNDEGISIVSLALPDALKEPMQ